MRLHHLTVTAFGPFADTHDIDFDALSAAGLFLVHGATGAGKTSVLDAVCFALYGQVPGGRDGARSLRSDHAPADRGPEVVLEATVRDRRLRIARSPAWQRPKRRGTGHTEEKAKVVVRERTGGAWVTRATRHDEAGDFILRLMGMSAAQFFQVVLLPQGDFARFLHADAESRRAVLEKLFATEIYTRVEEWLTDHARALDRSATEAAAAAESAADRVAEAVGGVRPELDPTGLSGWAVELSGHARDRRDALAAEVAAGITALAAAREGERAARDLVERRRRHATAGRRVALLAEREGERADVTALLAAAERAGRVLPLLATARARAERAERLAKVAAAACAALPFEAAEDPEVLRKAERARRDDLAALDQLRGDDRRLGELTVEQARVTARLAELEQDEARLAAALVDLPAARVAVVADLDGARAATAGLAGAEAAVAEAERRRSVAVRRDALAAEVATAAERHRAAVDAAQEARDRLQEVRQRRLDGMAAALAQDLRPGEACRVCGSTDHPAPAGGTGDLPDEDAAATADEHAQSAREATGTALGRFEAELDALAEDASVAELAGLLAGVRAAAGELAATAAGVARLEDELARIEGELAEAQGRHESVAAQLAAERARLSEAGAEADRLGERIGRVVGPGTTLEAEIARLRAEADRVSAAARDVELATGAAAEEVTAVADAERAAVVAGFASGAEAGAAALPESRAAELGAALKVYDDEVAAARSTLADPELVAAAAAPEPEMDCRTAELALVEAAHTAACSARDAAERRCDRLADLAAQLRARAARWRPAAAEHAVAARLAELARGTSADNVPRIRLSAFVLAARLAQVVAAANDRLGRMSGGRYTLLHTTARSVADGRKRAVGGLGLRVADAWTGAERDPVTLSGGESFITSLALALGLADVVAAEAGGAEIGTLFVDEGFGTLDPDALEEVMSVLDGLRSGGRAVGVVSHVAELRTRIPARLYVQKESTGSSLAVLGT